jgi:IclR family pca regulon transcriptional regulator
MPKIAADTKTRTTRTSKTQRAGIADPLPVSAAAEIQALSGDPNFMTSLARGLVVIQAFSQQKRHLTIAQISQKTGIPRAAVRRCLYTLAQLGYVNAEDGRNFALRPKILALGHAYLSSGRLATSAQPLLEHVTRTVHESCSMAILEGDDILYVARSSTTTRIVSIDLGVGSRLPAFCTSMGRVLLADLPLDELAAYLARVADPVYQPYADVAGQAQENA